VTGQGKPLPDPYAERVLLEVPLTIREVVTLREIAAGAKQTPENYLAWIARNIVAADLARDRIVQLWGKGYRDKQIAQTLGLTNLQVATRRRSAGLPAHPRRVSS